MATAWRRLAANFGALPGAELAISTTLPLASGMSSSSALLSGAALALADLAGLRETPTWRDHVGDDPLDWAMYLASIENGGDFGPLLGNGSEKLGRRKPLYLISGAFATAAWKAAM